MNQPSELIIFPDGAQYRRTGECNGCNGEARCCTYIKLPLARLLTEDEKYWAELHPGLSIEGQTVRFAVPCSALENGRCSLFGTRQRPTMCDLYPELPDLDEGCSYQFERIK